ncbi:hypothetical protein THI2018120TP_06150 [Staphylococcus aureus]|nr:hypothetical protein THI2018120TP_06150 [Staphylococcus aureus]
MNTEKLETLLGFYKQYKALSEYIDKKYKLSLNDLAVLDLTMKYCKDEKVLMQSFLKTAMDELDLSRTKLLVSIRRLIEKERLSKVRSSKDESSPDSCVKCYTMFLPFLLIKIDVFS